MKKSILLGICILLLVAGSAFAEGVPSSKFAATYTTEPGLASVAIVDDPANTPMAFDHNLGYTLATIKVPQDKELLVGVSAEIGLFTDTSVKGKLGGEAKAIAAGKGWVSLYAVPHDGGWASKTIAMPGPIALSARFQELDATLGGLIQSCQVTCTEGVDDNEGIITCDNINIAEDCYVTDEQIGLVQATLAAHHFNFVLPDMDQGVYDIKAVFHTGAFAMGNIDYGKCLDKNFEEVDPCVIAEGNAAAGAFVGKTMVTVQEVRAAKGGIIDAETFEQPAQ